ncbi:disulfide bond formation protein B [Solirhodobacter olei]|uniref:disulfide bond formation protein B n=1 Tax=Solirhodobacter olei TaxID=2493082 RepID=UPI000FD9A527|nr:disulfide bond formation protein B [Solirhodobacter olei]
MTRAGLVFLATLGSVALLGGALAFQYIGGLLPCHLCLLQRYPHAVAIAIGVVALVIPWRVLPWAGALAAAATSGLGVYHTGVERHWWAGPASCTSSMTVQGISAKDLLAHILAAPVVRCDEAAWSFLHLSMASWNAIFSAVLVLVWIGAALKTR